MEASVLDLRYRMKEVLRALDRREQVKILYHGKVKGIIVPAAENKAAKVSEHPFFGMKTNEAKPVGEVKREMHRVL
ncbi:MAG: type II toxin-antitoxin system Phd/YefM family antitoxin [Chitinispirillaceae bacterium]